MVSFRKETRLAIKNLQRKVDHLERYTEVLDKQIKDLKVQQVADKHSSEEKKAYVPDALLREYLTGEEVVDAESHRN